MVDEPTQDIAAVMKARRKMQWGHSTGMPPQQRGFVLDAECVRAGEEIDQLRQKDGRLERALEVARASAAPYSDEERSIVNGDWRPVLDAIQYAYKQLDRSADTSGYSIPDWNLAVHVHQYTTKHETSCARCKVALRWSSAYRCFDCRTALCELCAPVHFGPSHAKRAAAAHSSA